MLGGRGVVGVIGGGTRPGVVNQERVQCRPQDFLRLRPIGEWVRQEGAPFRVGDRGGFSSNGSAKATSGVSTPRNRIDMLASALARTVSPSCTACPADRTVKPPGPRPARPMVALRMRDSSMSFLGMGSMLGARWPDRRE